MRSVATLKRWQLLFFLVLIFAGIGASIGLGIAVYNIAAQNARITEAQAQTQKRVAIALTAIQTNRVNSIADLCRRDNRDNIHNLLFLQALNSRPSTIRTARKIYTLTADCDAYARRLVAPKRRSSIRPDKP